MTTQTAPAGTVFDVGGALAIYWPYVHPCHEPYDQYIVLTPEGGAEVSRELREGARRLGVIPGRGPHRDDIPTSLLFPRLGDPGPIDPSTCACCAAGSDETGFKRGSCTSSPVNASGCGHSYRSHFDVTETPETVESGAENARLAAPIPPEMYETGGA